MPAVSFCLGTFWSYDKTLQRRERIDVCGNFSVTRQVRVNYRHSKLLICKYVSWAHPFKSIRKCTFGQGARYRSAPGFAFFMQTVYTWQRETACLFFQHSPTTFSVTKRLHLACYMKIHRDANKSDSRLASCGIPYTLVISKHDRV